MEYNSDDPKGQKGKTARDVADEELNYIMGSETGAIKGAFKKKQKYNFQDGRWIAMSQAAMRNIATIDSKVTEKGKRLQGVDFRVFFYVSAVVDFENYLKVPTKEIAEELGIQPQNVSRSLAKLCDYGILLRGAKSGRSYTYRLNPHVGFKGKAKNQKDAVDEMSSDALERSKPVLKLVD